MAKARDFALLRPARGAFRSLSVGSAPDLHLPMTLDSGDAPVSRWIVSARVSSSELTACPQGTHAEPGPHPAPSTSSPRRSAATSSTAAHISATCPEFGVPGAKIAMSAAQVSLFA